jgi:hypothetical protein
VRVKKKKKGGRFFEQAAEVDFPLLKTRISSIGCALLKPDETQEDVHNIGSLCFLWGNGTSSVRVWWRKYPN